MEIKYAQGEELEKGWVLSLSMLRDVREKMREINNDGTAIPSLAQTELLMVALKLMSEEQEDDESAMVTLYTCNSGLRLFNKGMSFHSWVKNSSYYRNYKDNTKFKVNAVDIVIEGSGYRVVNLDSVKILK